MPVRRSWPTGWRRCDRRAGSPDRSVQGPTTLRALRWRCVEVSKERARRRAEREAAAEAERLRREKSRRRAETTAAVVGAVTEPGNRVRHGITRSWRRRYPPGDPLAPRRRRESLLSLVIVVLIQVVAWWFVPTWPARLGVFVLTLFLLPVLRTVLFDRR